MWAFALVLAVPVVEIALFIVVGGAIGILQTLALVFLSALLGIFLLRGQGGQAAAMMRQGVTQPDDPAEHVVHGAMIFLAAMLLVIPGFLTDAFGLVLLLPQVRRRTFAGLRNRARMQGMVFEATVHETRNDRPGDRVIDAEFEEIEPPHRPTHRPSGWTKH
ncbi:MAG: FxsA family protein [Rubellimicrobium sp.]|nr:FxsA family protein [Rubellimicrobium sp.]